MTSKILTLEDCARCLKLVNCKAHITGGTHKQCAPIDIRKKPWQKIRKGVRAR